MVSLLKRLGPKLLISLALGGLFAWLTVRGGVPLVPRATAFAELTVWAIPVYLVTLITAHFFRASRWRFLIRPVRRIPLKEVIALNWVGFFAIFALPMRLGEVTRPALTKARHKISVSIGFGTVAVERVLDGLITSICVAWALFALPRVNTNDPYARELPTYATATLVLFVSAFVALFVFLWKRDFALRFTRGFFGIFSERLGAMVAEKLDGIADGIRSLTDVRLAGGFLAESFAYWGLNATGIWLLAVGTGLPLSFGHAVGLMGILAIGILLPTGPGLFGNFQLALSTALKFYFAEDVVGEQGAAFIFLLYSIQALWIVAAGIVPLYTMDLGLSDLLGTEQIKQGLSNPPQVQGTPVNSEN